MLSGVHPSGLQPYPDVLSSYAEASTVTVVRTAASTRGSPEGDGVAAVEGTGARVGGVETVGVGVVGVGATGDGVPIVGVVGAWGMKVGVAGAEVSEVGMTGVDVAGVVLMGAGVSGTGLAGAAVGMAGVDGAGVAGVGTAGDGRQRTHAHRRVYRSDVFVWSTLDTAKISSAYIYTTCPERVPLLNNGVTRATNRGGERSVVSSDSRTVLQKHIQP